MQELGPYRLEEELGRGGMGVVWRARDTALDRTVAVKVLLRTLASPSDLERFRREALAQARLRHPSIVGLLTCGSTATGQPYLVLDHVQGRSLAHAIRERGVLPVREAMRIVAALARAIDYAHSRGVLHRDLKASNVLLEAETGEPVLIDFGLACLTGSPRLTQTGQMLGTPGCMAPEQAMGELSQIGPRTDVYGLGVVLLEALTGHSPFEGNEFLRLLNDVVAVAPPRPSARRPGLDPRLDEIALRCLEKDPARRWPTAAALAEALEAELATPPRASAGGRRAGLAAAVAAALAGWAGFAALALRAPPARPPRGGDGAVAAVGSDLLVRTSRELVAEAAAASSAAAAALLDRAVALAPTEALAARARLRVRAGDDAGARRDLRALDGGGPDGAVVGARGLALLEDDLALEAAERAVAATGGRDAGALAARGLARLARSEPRGAQEDAAAAAALDPAEPLGLLLRATAGETPDAAGLLAARRGFEARGEGLGVAATLYAQARGRVRSLRGTPSPDWSVAGAELDAALAEAPALRRALRLRALLSIAFATQGGRVDRERLARGIEDATRFAALVDHEEGSAELLGFARLRLALDPARGLDLGEASRAEAALTRGLERSPASPTLLVSRAELKATVGDAVGAEADARAARAVAGEGEGRTADRAVSLLARLRWRRGEVTAALELLAPLAGAGSRAPCALTERSLVLSLLRRAAEAREEAERALALDPALGRAHLARSRALVAGGEAADLRPALAAAEEAARLVPGFAQALADVAALRARLGLADLRETALALRRAAALEPWAAEHHADLAAILDAAGAEREAGAALEQALALDPTSAQARGQRARRRLLQGDARGALTDLLAVTARQPWNADAWLSQATARRALRDDEGALLDVDRALSLEPGVQAANLAPAYTLRALLRCVRGDAARARSDAERAVELDPGSSDALGARGQARALTGDLGGALGDLESALARSPGEPRWRLERAALLLRGDEAARARARAELEALIAELRPGDELARAARALLAAPP